MVENYSLKNTINSFPILIEELSKNNKKNYTSVLKKIAISEETINSFSSWSKDHYTRTCIFRNQNFELLLICWEAGQFTPVHAHNNQDCWVYMVSGELCEKKFTLNNKKLNKINESILHPKDVSFVNDKLFYHSMCNNSSERSISLHIYAKPIDCCDCYNETEEKFTPKKLTYTQKINY